MPLALVRLALCAFLAVALGLQAGEQWLLTQVTAQISRTDRQLARPRETALVAERVFSHSPVYAQAAFARAQVAAQRGEHSLALEWLARCEGRVVNQARWLRTAAFALYHLERHPEALAALEKAHALDPSLPDQEVRMLNALRERVGER